MAISLLDHIVTHIRRLENLYFCAHFKDDHLRFLLCYRMSQIHPRRALRSVIFNRLTFNTRLTTFILFLYGRMYN